MYGEMRSRAVRSGTNVEVVDLLELALNLGVHVVLVRRVGGPVAARGQHLAHQQVVGVKVVAQGVVVDLAGTATCAAQVHVDVARRAVGDLQAVGGPGRRDGEPTAAGGGDGRSRLARQV